MAAPINTEDEYEQAIIRLETIIADLAVINDPHKVAEAHSKIRRLKAIGDERMFSATLRNRVRDCVGKLLDAMNTPPPQR